VVGAARNNMCCGEHVMQLLDQRRSKV
jgi:hypothetical protein